MITVNRFQVSPDMKTLTVQVTADTTKRITSFKLQTDETYLDIFIDFSNKLSTTSEVSNIILDVEDLNINSFNGIYFATFETNEIGVEPVTVSACNFSQFFYAINDSLTKINEDCLSCNDNLQNTLLMDLYLEGLKNALIVNKYTNAIVNFYSLRKLCKGNIDACFTGCASGYGILDGSFTLV